MKSNTPLLLGAGLLLLLFLGAKAGTTNAAGDLDLSQLTDDQSDLNRLNSLYSELLSRGLSNLQILFMLSQILFESGLLTNVANYPLINQNNYAGLTATSGGYASYNSISDFVTAYLGFLTKGSNPLGASNLTDFNNRLVSNGYYTEDAGIYYNGLLKYYNLLSSTA